MRGSVRRSRQRAISLMIVSLCLLWVFRGIPAQGDAGNGPASETGHFRTDSRHCGVNALYAALQLMGYHISYQQVLDSVPVGEKGSSLAELQSAAAQYGVHAEAVQGNLDALNRVDFPVIAHFDFGGQEGHYVVLTQKMGNRFTYIDGGSGTTYSLYEGDFRNRWSGALLVFKGQKSPSWVRWFEGFAVIALFGSVGVWLYGWSMHRTSS